MDAISVFGIINTASFSFGAILICLTCLVYMVLHRRYEKTQSKLLLAAIIALLANAVSSMTAEVLKQYILESTAAMVSVFASNYLYFVAHTLLSPVICVYFFVVCGNSRNRSRLGYILPAIPFAVAELFALINPFTHWVYYYGQNMAFTRNWAIYFLYIVAAFYILYGIYTLFRSWRALTIVKRRAISYFFLMVCFGVGVQLVQPEVRVELFAEAVAVLGVMLFVENEDDMIDSEIGVYNRQALKMNLDSYVRLGKPFYVVAVRVSNADSLNHLGGTLLTPNALANMLADYFKSIIPWYYVYRAAPMRFMIIDPSMDEARASALATKIANRFAEHWTYGEMDFGLHGVVALACVPDELPASEDVFYLLDTPVPSVSEGLVLKGNGLDYLVRRAEVERAVQRGFEEDSYEVYYQPVLRSDGLIYAAEALMRLNDSVLGSVPPFEFIEVAERMGLIEGIGDIALRKTCEFLQSGVPQSLGIQDINVNLSVLECMQTDFIDRVKGIVAEYDVPASLVGFEITESIAAGDYGFFVRAMDQLKHEGHRFSMDDFGTGYSNMHLLLTLDFDVVKIDKSVLWDADKSSVGMAVLEHSVSLLRNAGCKVLVEGVETESQFKLLQQLGVDYYQGFCFAKPMPKDEFVAYVEQHQVSL